jgi:hypothetical protein
MLVQAQWCAGDAFIRDEFRDYFGYVRGAIPNSRSELLRAPARRGAQAASFDWIQRSAQEGSEFPAVTNPCADAAPYQVPIVERRTAVHYGERLTE